MITHQFSLFGFQKPKAKVPISKARIISIQKDIEEGRGESAAFKMAVLRDRLEAFEARLG